MQLGMVGLGRMGANIIRRVMRDGHTGVAFDTNAQSVAELEKDGALGATTLEEFVAKLDKPRVAWVMIPAGITGSVVETLAGEKGTPVVFDQVLLVSSGDGGSVTIGKPTVSGAKVRGEIVEQTRGEKLVVFKFRLRKNYVRRNGHRPNYTAGKVEATEA